MMIPIKRLWPVLCVALTLLFLLTLTLKPYHGNVSALFHLDTPTAETISVPKNFIVLQAPGYDGEQYYQIARHMPLVFQPSRWGEIDAVPTIAYSYQRFLLPFTAFVLAGGQEVLLPYSFLLIQIFSLLATCVVMVKFRPKKPLYAIALALCPAATIGLHFSLAEPLALLLFTIFLTRFTARTSLHAIDIVVLSLIMLSREVHVLFLLPLGLYLLWQKRWKDCFLLIIPLLTFICLHLLIYGIFHEIPFLWSTDKHSLPFQAVLELLSGKYGWNTHTYSSIALFFLFVLPGMVWTVWNLCKKTMDPFLPLVTLFFFGIMTLMPDHIWGSITSIGRVITPVYPLFLLQAVECDTLSAKMIAGAVLLLGLTIGLALALLPHAYLLS